MKIFKLSNENIISTYIALDKKSNKLVKSYNVGVDYKYEITYWQQTNDFLPAKTQIYIFYYFLHAKVQYYTFGNRNFFFHSPK